jgi:hypothetical protein
MPVKNGSSQVVPTFLEVRLRLGLPPVGFVVGQPQDAQGLEDAPVVRVEPRLRRPKYFGFGRAWMLRTGTTNRIPSTDATSPPPHSCASGTFAWVLTSSASTSANVTNPYSR